MSHREKKLAENPIIFWQGLTARIFLNIVINFVIVIPIYDMYRCRTTCFIFPQSQIQNRCFCLYFLNDIDTKIEIKRVCRYKSDTSHRNSTLTLKNNTYSVIFTFIKRFFSRHSATGWNIIGNFNCFKQF